MLNSILSGGIPFIVSVTDQKYISQLNISFFVNNDWRSKNDFAIQLLFVFFSILPLSSHNLQNPSFGILASSHFSALIKLILLRFDWSIICYEANWNGNAPIADDGC